MSKSEQAANKILYTTFSNCYYEYESFLAKEPKKAASNVFVEFGVPGAGKSTFLARLKSKLSPEDFYTQIIDRKQERIVLEEVTMGSSPTSVTIVPRLHKIDALSLNPDEMAIYDVPGFKDTDENKRIIINILHKCLLNHVKDHKFIAVLKFDLLEEDRLGTLIADYYDEFAKLFGSNLRQNIDNIYFVLTNVDKKNGSGYDPDKGFDEVKMLKLQGELTRKAAKIPRPDFPYFVSRMTEKAILVDYRNDTQDSLVRKLKEMVANETENKILQGQITIPHLDLFENELNKKLTKDLSDFLNAEKKKMEINWVKSNATQKSIIDSKNVLIHRKQMLTGFQIELSGIEKFLSTVNKSIDLINKDIASLNFEKAKLNEDAAAQDKIMAVVDSSLKDEAAVNVRVDVARPAMFGKWFVQNDINFDPSICKDRTILITSYEPNDDTMKRFFGTNSIIPPDLTKVNQFTASNVVLYNNNQIIYKGINVNVTYNDFNRQLKVDIQADVQFKFFVYYTTDLTKTPVVDKVKSSFAQKASQNRQKVVTIDSSIKEHQKRIDSLKLENKEKLDRQAILKTNITSLSTEIATLTKTIKDGHKDLEKELNDEIASVQSIQKEELYLVGDKIIKIFQKNSLTSNIQEQVSNINKFVEEESAKIKTWRDNFTASLDEVLNSEENS